MLERKRSEEIKKYQILLSFSGALVSFGGVYLWGRANEVFLCLVIMGVSLGLLIAYRSYSAIFWYVCGGIIFPLIEVLMVGHLVWYYYSWSANYLPVPLWLFPLWGNVTLIIRKTDLRWLWDKFNLFLEELDHTIDWT